MFVRALTALGLLSLAACHPGGPPSDAVTLDWSTGQLFYVGASYRMANVKTVEMATDLDDPHPDFDEYWSDEVVWTYQVVDTGLVPATDDELYPYAVRADGSVASLAVVRAYLDESLNDPSDVGAADPVVYLVFREDRDRLAAIVSFTDVDGERVEQAWSSKELGKSWSALSQSMLTAAPTYLAPFAARYADESKVLENGSVLDTVTVDDGVVDTWYDDELGGGLVMSRYEAGQPWPTLTETDNVQAHLLTDDEVTARRAEVPFLVPGEPEDFDFKAALQRPVDIDAALTLDADTMDGGFTARVREGYRPWAGSWWSLRRGALVFGYRNGPLTDDTISDRAYGTLRPLKRELEVLSDEIRDLPDGPDKEAKRTEYSTKQKAFVDQLVSFYGGILQGLRGGTIVVDNDTVRSTTDGWSYDLDTLSPMDKMALVLYLDGQTNPNPFYMPAWELLNSWAANDAGDNSWWGHCNGWSAAAILEFEPRQPVDVSVGGQQITFDTADLKGLATESHYSVYSRFYGSRYYKEGDDISDLSPKAFHQLVTFYFRDQGVPFVFDTTADAPVWNFPAWGVDLAIEETTPANADSGKINVNTADLATLDTLPGIGASLAKRIIDYREANGPFQAPEDLQRVSGIGSTTYARLADLITVSASTGERTFDVVAEVQFSTDGVDEAHVDSGTSPEGFTETYGYTLVTDADGRVISGTWDNEREHPDFAWIPYNNPTTAASNSSENPYLVYGDVIRLLGDRRR